MKYLLILTLLCNTTFGTCMIPCYESYNIYKTEKEDTYLQHNIFGLQNLNNNTLEIPINIQNKNNHRLTLLGQSALKFKIQEVSFWSNFDKQGKIFCTKIVPVTGKSIRINFTTEDPGNYIMFIKFEKRCQCEDCKCTPENHCGCLDD